MKFKLWEVFVVMQINLHALRARAALVLSAAVLGGMVLPAYAAPESVESVDELVVMPIAENQDCATYQGVRVQGKLRATDPDGGALTYELVEMPKKGTVTLDEEDGSVFVYTPNEGKTGKDSFSFCVTDEDGNVTGLESKRCMQAGRRQRA